MLVKSELSNGISSFSQNGPVGAELWRKQLFHLIFELGRFCRFFLEYYSWDCSDFRICYCHWNYLMNKKKSYRKYWFWAELQWLKLSKRHNSLQSANRPYLRFFLWEGDLTHCPSALLSDSHRGYGKNIWILVVLGRGKRWGHDRWWTFDLLFLQTAWATKGKGGFWPGIQLSVTWCRLTP